MTFQLDSTSWRLLRMLQENARHSFRQIGEAIGLTAPAATERIRRLEDAGIITGYHAEVDLAKVGLPILAFVHVTTTNQQSYSLRKAVIDMPEVIECHCITGSESYILKVAVTSVPRLEHFLMKMKDHGQVRTSVVLSTQVSRRVIDEYALQTDTEEVEPTRRGQRT